MIQLLLYLILVQGEDQSIRIEQSCSTGLTGYFWNGQQCIQCKQPSCKCAQPNECSSCLNSYYYDETSQTCTRCPLGCLKCCKSYQMTLFICTLCDQGFLMISGVCLEAKACNSVSIHGKCQNCQASYYLNQNCIKCPDGCSSCDSQYYCTSCYDGYFIDIVADTVACTSCNSATSSGCSSCYYNDAKKLVCTSCLLNYYYEEAAKVCKKCVDNCLSCQNPALEPQLCYECGFNYILSPDSSSCQSCSDQIANCMSCILNREKSAYLCAQCNNGYYLQVNKLKCLSCNNGLNNVRRCDSTTAITQCNSGYLLLQDESNNFKCVKNEYNCFTIDTKSQCFNCAEGAILVFDSSLSMNVCKDCQQNIENCLICDANSNKSLICKTCENGYYPNDTCVKCTDNCAECLNQTECKTCVDGYFMDSSKQCQSCEVNFCLTCSTVGTCTKCQQYYGLIKGICQQCLVGCWNCDGNGNTCNYCAETFYLTLRDNTCKRYKQHCLSSNINGYCYLCETIIDSDPSMDVFQDENTQVPTNYTVAESIFYISNNGYCLVCNDEQTGTFNCPQVCAIEEQHQYLLNIIMFILFIIY